MLGRTLALAVLMSSAVPASALAEGNARSGSVILSAEDVAGLDLVDVAVSIDGKAGPTRLDGRALDIDPGEHTFVFKLADGKKAERKVTIRAGEKNKCVSVTIGAPAAVAAAPVVAPLWTASNAGAGQPIYVQAPAAASRPLRTIGFVAIGTGVASLVGGAVVGMIAAQDMKSSCDTSTKVCEPGTVGDTKSAATVATVGFVAGGALAAAGLALVFLAPKTRESARVTAAPSVGLNGGGVSLQGAF